MEFSKKAIKAEYKRLRESGIDYCDAFNQTVTKFGGAYSKDSDNTFRKLTSDYLRESWASSLDRKIGIKSGRGRTYKVYNLDVWGNPKDGFEVNNWWSIGTIFVPECSNDRDILRIMRENYLSERSKGRVRIDHTSSPDFLTIEDRKTGEPVFNLELTEDKENV